MKTNRVWTPNGIQVGKTNSLVGKGESIIDYTNGTSTLVTGGKKGVDNQPSSVSPNDSNVIAGNDIDYIGYYHGKTSKPMSFADQVAPFSARLEALNSLSKEPKNAKLSSLSKQTQNVLGREIDKAKQPLLAQMKEITDRQELQHDLEQDPQYGPVLANKGKDGLPKFKKGSDSVTNIPWTTRMMPTALGTLAGLAQLNRWGRTPIQYHDTYQESPYSTRGLNELASLRYNAYPAVRAMQDAERRGAYANEQAGGMTSGQRYMGRIALGMGAMQNAANVYSAAQQQNNAYRQQYANALLNEGNQIAQRRQNAAQHDWADYVAAHGRKTKGIETSVANILNQINSGYANEFKYRTWRDTARMYQQELDDNKMDILSRIGNGNSTSAAAPATVNRTPSLATPPFVSRNNNIGSVDSYGVFHDTRYTPSGAGYSAVEQGSNTLTRENSPFYIMPSPNDYLQRYLSRISYPIPSTYNMFRR